MLFSAKAATINIGHSASNTGRVQKKDIANILKCATENKDHIFKFQEFPNLRGQKYLKATNIDAYYPVHVDIDNRDESLLPIYIDEVLMLSKKAIDMTRKQDIGVVRGEHTSVLEDYKNLQPAFLVNNISSLLKGLEGDRVGSIIMYRSQLPSGYSLKKLEVKTIVFKDVGIQINFQFMKKVDRTHRELQDHFIRCILNYDFNLSNIRKRAIHMAMTKDLDQITRDFSQERDIVAGIAQKEKLWISGDKSIIEPVLNNPLVKKLKKLSVHLPFINEAFIFNHQGALLATLKMTSDFDQSDEEKFTIVSEFSGFSIRNISNIHFDESSNIYQVGLLIRLENKKGEFAGGLYIGADINRLITHYKLN